MCIYFLPYECFHELIYDNSIFAPSPPVIAFMSNFLTVFCFVVLCVAKVSIFRLYSGLAFKPILSLLFVLLMVIWGQSVLIY